MENHPNTPIPPNAPVQPNAIPVQPNAPVQPNYGAPVVQPNIPAQPNYGAPIVQPNAPIIQPNAPAQPNYKSSVPPNAPYSQNYNTPYRPQNSTNQFIDFFTFKFMILEVVLPIIFALCLLGLVIWSISIMSNHFIMGAFVLVGGSLGLRIAFELVMVMFSILGTLRQIRDKLPDKNTQH